MRAEVLVWFAPRSISNAQNSVNSGKALNKYWLNEQIKGLANAKIKFSFKFSARVSGSRRWAEDKSYWSSHGTMSSDDYSE